MISVVIDVYKFGQEFFIIVIFWEHFVQIHKKNSSWSCIKHMQKIICNLIKKKFHPDEIFQHRARIQPPYLAEQIKRAIVTSVPKSCLQSDSTFSMVILSLALPTLFVDLTLSKCSKNGSQALNFRGRSQTMFTRGGG